MTTSFKVKRSAEKAREDTIKESAGSYLKWSDRVVVYLEGVQSLQIASIEQESPTELKVTVAEGQDISMLP